MFMKTILSVCNISFYKGTKNSKMLPYIKPLLFIVSEGNFTTHFPEFQAESTKPLESGYSALAWKNLSAVSNSDKSNESYKSTFVKNIILFCVLFELRIWFTVMREVLESGNEERRKYTYNTIWKWEKKIMETLCDKTEHEPPLSIIIYIYKTN
jgi:hypothetical protein